MVIFIKNERGIILKSKDLLLGIIVVTVWGLNFIAMKWGLLDMPPIMLASFRFILASIPAIFFVKKPPVSWKLLISLALTINVGQFAFLFLGMKYGMPAGIASLVHQSQVFFSVILAYIILKEKIKMNNIIGILVSFLGIVLIASSKASGMSTIGFLLTIIGSFCWGYGNIYMKIITAGHKDYPVFSLIIWASAVAILPLIFLSLIFEGVEPWMNLTSNITTISIFSFMYLAYAGTLIGYGLWGKLLSNYKASQVAPLSLLVPVVGLSSAYFVFLEKVNLISAFGCIAIMFGLIINMGIIKISDKKA